MTDDNFRTREVTNRIDNYRDFPVSAIHYTYGDLIQRYGDDIKRVVNSVFKSIPWFKNFVTVNRVSRTISFHCEGQEADKVFMVMSAFRNNMYIEERRDSYIRLLDQGYTDLFCLVVNSLVYKRNAVFAAANAPEFGFRQDGDYNLFLYDSFGKNSLRKLLETLADPKGPNLWRQDLWNNQHGYRKDAQIDERFLDPLGEERSMRASDGMSLEGDEAFCDGHVHTTDTGDWLVKEAVLFGEIESIFNEFNLQIKV